MADGTHGNGVQASIRYLEEQVGRLWEHKASKDNLTHLEGDIEDIRRDLGSIKSIMDQRIIDRQKEKDEGFKERKADRRWIIGTILVSAGVIVAALTLIVSTLQGG